MRGSRSAHSRQQKREVQSRGGAHSAFHSISTQPLREKKAEVIKNLKYLEDENQRLTDFMKKLGVLVEKIKHKGALIKHDIASECDNLVKIIEKKKRSMMYQVDKQQSAKVRELEVQLTGCRRVFSSSHSVVVRTNRDLQHLSSQAFLNKGDILIADIDRAISDHPQHIPNDDDEYNLQINLTEQRRALDRMELTQLDSESEHYYESESFESKSQSTPRSHTTSGRHLIQNLMDDEHEDGKKGRTRKRKDAKQSEKPQKRTEKDESNGHVDDALEQQHETKKKSDSETGKDALNDPHTQAVQNQPEKAPDSPREETESPIESEDRPHSSKHSERKTSEAPEEVAEEILQMNDTPSQQNTSRSPSASTIKSERETKKSDTPVGSRQSLRGESVNESNDIKEHIEEQ